jgi:hypothetical protein
VKPARWTFPAQKAPLAAAPKVTLAKSAGGVLTFWRASGICMRGNCLRTPVEPGAPYCRLHVDKADEPRAEP